MKTALVLVAFLGVTMAVPERTARIVGGTDTTIQQYNFMASMHYLWFGFFWSQSCGGAMLTSSTVLSAAHCYHGDQPNQWRAQLGSSFPTSGGQIFSIRQIRNHERYNDDALDNDVSIVFLNSAAQLGATIGTVLIAGPNYNLPDNTGIWAVGWGDLEYDGWAANVLQHVEVFTINWQLCAERYAYLKTLPGYERWPDITSGMACAGILGVGGKDACSGDSGGPVLHNGNVVYGVTSWGFECANGTFPGVNAAVPYFADWIVANGSA